MADQTRKPKPKKDEEQAKAEKTETTESKTEDIDDLLDEIDEVLEVNSEEFVRSFIQKGGQLVIPAIPMADGSTMPRPLLIVLCLTLYVLFRIRNRATL